MSESEVNIPLLRKAVEWVEAEATKPLDDREWYQKTWIRFRGDPVYDNKMMVTGTACGTAYCVAGYIAQLVDENYRDRSVVAGVHSSEVAQNALGLDEDDAFFLFHANNSAEKIREIAERIAGEPL